MRSAAFWMKGCPSSLASRRRSSTIISGMSMRVGQTGMQAPHWMQSDWMSFEDLSASNQVARMAPMPPV